MNDTYYTVPEVALLLKVSKSYIYDLINQNKLEHILLSKRRTRIPANALEQFLIDQIDKKNGKTYNKGVVQPLQRGLK